MIPEADALGTFGSTSGFPVVPPISLNILQRPPLYDSSELQLLMEELKWLETEGVNNLDRS
jgi:hypothetical protein